MTFVSALPLLAAKSPSRVPVERLPSPAGEERAVYRLTRSFVPPRSGPLEYPSSFLEFGRVSKGGVFTAQRKIANYFVLAPAFSLSIVPLP